jgi:DNA-binding NarL/FixJ family response regulator
MGLVSGTGALCREDLPDNLFLNSLETGSTVATEAIFETIDVFLLAENRLLRDALTKILNKKSDIRVVAASAFSPQALQQITDLAPHVLLLDGPALGMSQVEIIAAARKALPGLKVVMIGMELDKEAFLRFVRAGVAGYILKDAPASEVAAAVRAAATDEAVCPPRLCLALFECIARQWTQIPRFGSRQTLGLTRREQQLVEMVGCGLTNKEIANKLNLSDQTVKNHIHRILQKLGVSDRLSAVEVCRIQNLSA